MGVLEVRLVLENGRLTEFSQIPAWLFSLLFLFFILRMFSFDLLFSSFIF